MSKGCAVFIHLGLTLCDLSFSVPLTSFFVTVLEWFPFLYSCKSSVKSLMWQISSFLNLFPRVYLDPKLLLKTVGFPSVFWVFFYFLILFNSLCMFGMLLSKAPAVCLNWFQNFAESHPEPLYHRGYLAMCFVRAVFLCITDCFAPLGNV